MPVSRAKRLLRTREAAAYLSLSAWKLRSLVADGELPVVQADDSSPFLSTCETSTVGPNGTNASVAFNFSELAAFIS
jgi:hypothetical protein